VHFFSQPADQTEVENLDSQSHWTPHRTNTSHVAIAMLLLSTTLLLAGLHHTLPAVARPVVGASSILSSPDAFNALPEGMTPLPREDMMELGRLALAVK
jgi:hypothetical protein